MPAITPPKYAAAVLSALEAAGFEAYMVGGCVRDALMHRRAQDWDICTSALPEQTERVFPRTHPTGLKHGTVTVVSAGHPIEVTTFRADGEYLDHRRPESVQFVSSLEADLRRRDFTINAMAMPLSGDIRDPFGGRADIQARLIRCVGESEERFSEDALRMLRALRFSAVLDFEIEENTYAAITRLAPLCAHLAAERVCTELKKALCSARPERAADMLALGLLCRIFGDARPVLDLSPLSRLPKEGSARLAGFCALLRRGGVIDSTGDFLRALRLDSETTKNVAAGVEAALAAPPESEADFKRLSARIGDGGCFCAAAAAQTLGQKNALALWRGVLRQNDCRSISSLAVSGKDLAALGFKGAEIGAALSGLLDAVISQPELNEKDTLLALALKIK